MPVAQTVFFVKQVYKLYILQEKIEIDTLDLAVDFVVLSTKQGKKSLVFFPQKH